MKILSPLAARKSPAKSALRPLRAPMPNEINDLAACPVPTISAALEAGLAHAAGMRLVCSHRVRNGTGRSRSLEAPRPFASATESGFTDRNSGLDWMKLREHRQGLSSGLMRSVWYVSSSDIGTSVSDQDGDCRVEKGQGTFIGVTVLFVSAGLLNE
jgi:hypothetical protein